MSALEADAESGKKHRSILELSHDEAKSFLLRAESYCNFDLPPYIVFDQLLLGVAAFLDKTKLSDCQSSSPRDFDDLNHVILNNKDGKYAWRPMQLIHPALYVSLVHAITDESHWATIRSRFSEFSANPKIKCLSLPLKVLTNEKDKAEQITNWWQEVEQKTIELSLDYEYLAQTDITDCYGAIYTHSVAWALHTKPVAKKKENRDNKNLIGVLIDCHLQDMSHGQTNGIPQGSVAMDFIAEMVLGYADHELSQKLGILGINDYKILRYRDDYRVFVNNPQDGEKILKAITEILIGLGLKLNPSKTTLSNQVIHGAIKIDKLHWLVKKQSAKSLQKHLLIIHEHAARFPNSGSVVTALTDYYTRILDYKNISESLMPLISIVVDIAYHNPRTYPIVSAILSKLISLLDNEEIKNDVVGKVKKRFNQLPNIGHMQIWLQRVSQPFAKSFAYDEQLCKLVSGEPQVIWNVDWISSKKLKGLIDPHKIINKKKIDNLLPVIPLQEVALFVSKAQGYH